MFRSARWRSEKNKIKYVFKLQFHATQVSQVNVDTLMISVVPADLGKATARLEKGIIREGICRWENPVYETVKFTQDARTGKINERIYHFIVSTGSSKNSLIGEASIDLANYPEAIKVSTASLPLKNSKSNGVLHISIQRLQGNIDQRDVEETEVPNIKTQNRTLNTLLSNSDAKEGIKSNPNEVRQLNDTNHNSEQNYGDRRTSSGSDITMSSSESSSGLNTPRELGLRNNILQDPTSFQLSRNHASAPHKPTANASATINEGHQQSQWEWSADSDHGINADDLINGSQGTFTRERSQGTSDVEIEKLNAEIISLARQVDLSELELQTLRKQIVKESKRGQDLSREITGLKEERDAFKAECEKLKAFQQRIESKSKNKSRLEGGDPQVLLDEIRQELNYEKDLNANLRLQLQKTQESNAELIFAVRDLEEMLDQKNREVLDPSNKARCSENSMSRSETDDDEEQKALEELVKEHRDAKETCLLEQKIIDLSSEIEIYRRDKDELEMQMEQLALDYEILKQENHDMSYKLEQSQLQEQLKMQYECSSSFANMNELEAQIESLENKLQKQSKEYSDSLVIIGELENHIKSLEDELEKQAQRFEVDLDDVTNAKIEQEQKVIQAEEALRKTRWKNANTAEKLQEEVKRLSVQMASTFEANEKVAMKAMAEVNELRIQKSQLEQMLQKANEELQSVRDDYEAKLSGLTDRLNLKVEQVEQMSAEIDDKSKQLEHQKKHEEELAGSFSEEILRLKGELEKLTIENSILSEQTEQKENMRVELEQLKVSLKHTEELVQKGNMERTELVSTLPLVKKEAEKLMEELNRMKSLKDEKETAMDALQTEVDALKAQCEDLKHSFLEDESEKEKLRKQVFQLKGDLKKKDDTISSIEKKLKESNRRSTVSDTKTTLRNNKSAPVPHGIKETANLREKIKLLEGQIKLKEAALETSANSFYEKERDLLNKIEELEKIVEELNQNSAILIDNPCQKLHQDSIGITSDGGLAEDKRSTDLNLSSMVQMPNQNGNAKSLINSNGDSNINELLSNEVESLKERNKLMEHELKEMQERYSEISLKFAEVEGERQQLVMTLRNLKNSKKT